MVYERLSADITAPVPVQTENATDVFQQAAAYGVYAGVADLTKWLIVGGVIVIASALIPWKDLYREITQ